MQAETGRARRKTIVTNEVEQVAEALMPYLTGKPKERAATAAKLARIAIDALIQARPGWRPLADRIAQPVSEADWKLWRDGRSVTARIANPITEDDWELWREQRRIP